MLKDLLFVSIFLLFPAGLSQFLKCGSLEGCDGCVCSGQPQCVTGPTAAQISEFRANVTSDVCLRYRWNSTTDTMLHGRGAPALNFLFAEKEGSLAFTIDFLTNDGHGHSGWHVFLNGIKFYQNNFFGNVAPISRSDYLGTEEELHTVCVVLDGLAVDLEHDGVRLGLQRSQASPAPTEPFVVEPFTDARMIREAFNPGLGSGCTPFDTIVFELEDTPEPTSSPTPPQSIEESIDEELVVDTETLANAVVAVVVVSSAAGAVVTTASLAISAIAQGSGTATTAASPMATYLVQGKYEVLPLSCKPFWFEVSVSNICGCSCLFTSSNMTINNVAFQVLTPPPPPPPPPPPTTTQMMPQVPQQGPTNEAPGSRASEDLTNIITRVIDTAKPKECSCCQLFCSNCCLITLALFAILSKFLLVGLASLAIDNLSGLHANEDSLLNPEGQLNNRLSSPELLPQNITSWLGNVFVPLEKVVLDDLCATQENCIPVAEFVQGNVGPFTAVFLVYPKLDDVVSVLFASLSLDLIYALGGSLAVLASMSFASKRLPKDFLNTMSEYSIRAQLALAVPSVLLTLTTLALFGISLFSFSNHAGWIRDHGANRTLRVQAVHPFTVRRSYSRFEVFAQAEPAVVSEWCADSQQEFTEVSTLTLNLFETTGSLFCNKTWVYDDVTDCITSNCGDVFTVNTMHWFVEGYDAVSSELSNNILIDALLTGGEILALFFAVFFYYRAQQKAEKAQIATAKDLTVQAKNLDA